LYSTFERLLHLHPIPIKLPGTLALSPHPAGGDALLPELQQLTTAGFGHVASLLEPDEAAQLHLADEAEACARVGLCFHHLPVRDGSIPGFARYVAFMDSLAEALSDGQGLLVHCRHGIGRSSLVAIGLLLHAGVPYAEAVERVSQARGAVLPSTLPQGRLLLAYARHVLG